MMKETETNTERNPTDEIDQPDTSLSVLDVALCPTVATGDKEAFVSLLASIIVRIQQEQDTVMGKQKLHRQQDCGMIGKR